ncbi:MAG: metallophosphoesterase family protein [Bacteroidales bacterium]
MLFINPYYGFSQFIKTQQKIYFISDVQLPMKLESVFLREYRNEEARDSLFTDMINQEPRSVFILGDLTSRGSDKKAWLSLDVFLKSLEKINAVVYAIPGNHEYMGKSSAGMQMYSQRFLQQSLYGYSVNIDSIAIVMLNSNYNEFSEKELTTELAWYKTEMDLLDSNPAIKAIIVCTHHAPFSNSKIVGSSRFVQTTFLPLFEKSKKSKLFISGHSHNLEYFSDSLGKKYLVIGGGGGISQALIPFNKRIYSDLLPQDSKPMFFYLVVEKNGNNLNLIAKGFKKDFRFFELNIGNLKIN